MVLHGNKVALLAHTFASPLCPAPSRMLQHLAGSLRTAAHTRPELLLRAAPAVSRQTRCFGFGAHSSDNDPEVGQAPAEAPRRLQSAPPAAAQAPKLTSHPFCALPALSVILQVIEKEKQRHLQGEWVGTGACRRVVPPLAAAAARHARSSPCPIRAAPHCNSLSCLLHPHACRQDDFPHQAGARLE